MGEIIQTSVLSTLPWKSIQVSPFLLYFHILIYLAVNYIVSETKHMILFIRVSFYEVL